MYCPYSIQQIVGIGGFSEIFYASKDGSDYAIKTPLPEYVTSYEDFPEVSILRQVKSPYFIYSPQIVSSVECSKVNGYGIVMPYIQNNLSEYLGKERWDLIYKTIYSVAQLHEECILHLDIKASNILIDKDDVYLSDFGFSQFIDDPTQEITLGFCGTIVYRRLFDFQVGVLSRERIITSYKTDIFSLGMLLFYNVLGTDDIFDIDIETSKIPDYMRYLMSQIEPTIMKRNNDDKSDLLALIKSMLSSNPPTAKEILTDKFFANKGIFIEFQLPIMNFPKLNLAVNISSETYKLLNYVNSESYDFIDSRTLSFAIDLYLRVSSLAKENELQDTNFSSYDLYLTCKFIAFTFYKYEDFLTIPERNLTEMVFKLTNGILWRPHIYYILIEEEDYKERLLFLIQNLNQYESLLESLPESFSLQTND
jgi:serine/threonine protein kinase